jgi:hypothetical protein
VSSQDPVPTFPNILLDFYNSDSTSNREDEDILLRFDSDGAGKSRKPGEKYTEFDFNYLDERWLELTDESSDQINSGRSSTD